jgi:FKBP-type peptidyl-prolyl cis-trans isomerase
MAAATTTFTKTVLTAGNGPTPQKHQRVRVAADLYLSDGAGGKGTAIWSTHAPSGFVFSAKTGAKPFEYQVGVGSVVRGWEDGVAGMQLGESARLDVPWQHAYGVAGHPGFKIPGQADLVFEITVLEIR